MHLSEGTYLQGGKYKIIRFLASGGFGCTYEAFHLMLNKKVAIKEFFPKSMCNRDSGTSHVTVGTMSQKGLVDKLRNKFVNEAQSIAQLSHPGIVKVSDVFEENGTAYYVMDFIEGKSLDKIIQEKGPLSEQEAMCYIRQVSDALDYVHEQSRLHLDIKPGNIMVDKKGRSILIDFGASKQYDEENGENTSTLVGWTAGYAPLEQLGKDVSHFRPATDIYALGATLYKCLSGKAPLEANFLAQGEELDPLPSNVSPSTVKAIEAAMEVSPKKRPQTIKEFVSILDQSNTSEQMDEETLYDKAAKDPYIANSKEGKAQNTNGSSTANQNYSHRPSSGKSIPIQNSSSSDRYQHSKVNDTEEDTSKSPKTKIYLGAAAAVIVALLCWMVFGGKGPTQTNNTGEEIALVGDSLNQTDEQTAVQNQPGLITGDSLNIIPDVPVSEEVYTKAPTLQIVPPTNAKVGEEFEVVYRLADGQGVNFKANNITGCTKLSGPLVSENKNGQEYIFTYKTEKDGTYIIPSATVKVDGKSISSNTLKFTVKGAPAQAVNEPVSTQPEPTKTPATTTRTINEHEWVDLGLPSGLKWATCNVGATKPEEYGSYFAWGETRTKSSYTEENSETYGKDAQWLRSNGYIGSSGNLTLSHDAARQNWGGSWRMPTKREIEELVNNTTTEWTTRNGKYGRLVKSKNNGNSIFLPAAGWRHGSSSGYVGEYGRYWSSTPYGSDSEYVYRLGFSSGDFSANWSYRLNGLSVRPVAE